MSELIVEGRGCELLEENVGFDGKLVRGSASGHWWKGWE